MANVIAIAGSPSHPSRTSAVLKYAESILESKGWHVDLLSVRDLPAEDLVFANFDSPALNKAKALVEQASGVIISTPIYKASYTGVLKAFLDLLPSGAFSGKVVLPIATGGTLGHLLTIDYALKPVIATLGARYVLGGVYLLDSQIQLTNSKLQLEKEIEQRLKASLNEFKEAIRLVNSYQFDQSKNELVLSK